MLHQKKLILIFLIIFFLSTTSYGDVKDEKCEAGILFEYNREPLIIRILTGAF